MGRAALFARALWWRRGLGAAVIVVGIITTAVAALGPLYARAAAESTLSDRLASTSSAQTGLAFSAKADLSSSTAITATEAQLPAPGSVRGYPTRIVGASTGVTTQVGSGLLSLSTLVWREGACAHLIVISGRCPTSAHEGVVDDNALHARPNWALGQTIAVTGGQNLDADGPLLDQLTIVGSYRPANTNDPFWFGHTFFTAHLSPSAVPDLVDAIFVATPELAALPTDTAGTVQVDYPLDPSQVRLDSIDSLQRAVGALQQTFPAYGASAAGIAMRTQLADVLGQSRNDHHQVDVDTLLVIVELAILCWLALFGVVADAIGARGNDVALAKLRGHRPRSVLALAVGEPLALLLVALPFGLLAALGVAHVLARNVLVPGTPVVVTPGVGYAVLAAYAGGAVAALAAARTILTRPVLEQWRHATSNLARGRGAAGLLIIDVLLVAAAIGGVVALRARGDRGAPSALTLLAPGLLLFAISVAGVRLIPPILRRRLRSNPGGRRVAWFLAIRQLGRRPAGLRLAALLAVAVGLASFGIAAESVAAGNRTARAQTELGAPQVAAVQFQPDHDPQAAVAQVDPDGRWAMAAASWIPDGGAPSAGAATVVGPVLAVDPHRLAAIGTDVRGQVSMAAIASAISEPTAVVLGFTADQLRVRIDAESITGAAPSVGLRYRPAGQQQPVSVDAGVLQPGDHTYTASVDCPKGCAFAGITWQRAAGETDDEGLGALITAIDRHGTGGWQPLGADLTRADRWRGDKLGVDANTTLKAAANGLQVDVSTGDGASAILTYADTPARVPIVASPAALGGTGSAGAMADFSGSLAPFQVAKSVSVLPQVLASGAIADLDYLRILLPSFGVEATWSVWLGPHAPADAIERLRGAGLIVESVSTEHHRVAVLSRQAPALALLLLLVCAVAASVLAVGGTAISVAASGRRRSFEFAALGVVGVRHRVLRRAAVLEQALLLGAALVLGLPAGIIIARVVMPAIPEFSDATPTVLRYTPAATPLVVFAAVFAVLLLITAAVAGAALARAAVAARLREAQQ